VIVACISCSFKRETVSPNIFMGKLDYSCNIEFTYK